MVNLKTISHKAIFSLFFTSCLTIVSCGKESSNEPKTKPEPVNPVPNTPKEVQINNPLYYTAETNINKEQTGFAKKNTNEDATLITWEEAKNMFQTKDFLKGYHLPNRYEWQSIAPYADKTNYIRFKPYSEILEDSRTDEDYNVAIGNVVLKNTTSYYQTIEEDGDNVTYAIRFVKGNLVKENKETTLTEGNNPYISVWRYSYIDNPNEGGGKMMAVYCLVLPAETTIDHTSTLKINTGSGMIDFKNKDFFAEKDGTAKTDVIYREFATSGYAHVDYGPSPLDIGNDGGYWSSTPDGEENAYNLYFSKSSAYSNVNIQSFQFAVRPFIDAK